MVSCDGKEMLKGTTVGGLSIVTIMRRMKTAEGRRALTSKQLEIADGIRCNKGLFALVKECLNETSETEKEN